MEKNFNDIAYIEAWLRGEMEQEERRSFEEQMASDEALQQEVAAYRTIFSGFKGLKEEAFAGEVANWTREAKAKDRQKLKSVINKDKVVPMKKKAKKTAGAVRPMWQKLAVAASVILLLGIGGGWLLSRQYTNESLVASAYSPPLESATMGGQNPQANDLIKKFEAGHVAFKGSNYQDASTNFRAVIQGINDHPETFDNLTRSFYLENAKWSLLLSEFASGQLPEENFLRVLEFMAKDTASEYGIKAGKMRENLGSFWRKLAK